MSARLETPHVFTGETYADEFRRRDAYCNWRPHGTPDWLLIYTAAGAGRLTTETRQGATRPGDVTLYAPGELHDYRTDPEAGHWHLLWAHFVTKPSWLPWLHWPLGPHGVRSLHLEKGDVRSGFIAAMQRTIQVVRRRLPHTREFAGNALEEALLWTQLSTSQGASRRIDPRVRRAMDYLTANLRQPFRLEALARHAGLSVSRLAHLFKSDVGTSPQQFFEGQRMWHAGQLLSLTGLGVAEIGAEVGYDDPFYFSNRFRRYSGKSPSQFRQQGRRKDGDAL